MNRKILITVPILILLTSILQMTAVEVARAGCEDPQLVWNPHPNVQITFPEGSDIQDVTATELTGCPLFPKQIKSMFAITMDGDYDSNDGDIRVCISYDPTIIRNPKKLVLVRFDDDLVGDLNCDGIVNGRDISIIARALNTQPSDPKWNPICDINTPPDSVINLVDKGIAQASRGQTAWTVVPSTVDEVEFMVCGDTQVLSIWGIR